MRLKQAFRHNRGRRQGNGRICRTDGATVDRHVAGVHDERRPDLAGAHRVDWPKSQGQSTTVKRVYRSPLRAAQAGETRRAIVDAATRLFVNVGYGATSIDAIAEAAGVSRATVFAAVGSKAALLKTAYDVALVGDDEPVALPDRADARAIRAEPDPKRYLERYAGFVTGLGARVAAIYEATRGAASADPEIRPVWEKIQQERRIGAAHVLADTAAKGPLRDGIDLESAADVVWVLNDPGLYHLLVNVRGWPADRYREWLAESLKRELLDDR